MSWRQLIGLFTDWLKWKTLTRLTFYYCCCCQRAPGCHAVGRRVEVFGRARWLAGWTHGYAWLVASLFQENASQPTWFRRGRCRGGGGSYCLRVDNIIMKRKTEAKKNKMHFRIFHARLQILCSAASCCMLHLYRDKSNGFVHTCSVCGDDLMALMLSPVSSMVQIVRDDLSTKLINAKGLF